MSKLKRLRIWFCINFLGIWLWPSAKMDFVHITSYPPNPYHIAKLLHLSPWEYWLQTEIAMQREAAAMLDILGFTSEPTDYAKQALQWIENFKDFEPIIWKANSEKTVFDHDRFPDRFANRRYNHY